MKKVIHLNLSAKWRWIFMKLVGYMKISLPSGLKMFICVHACQMSCCISGHMLWHVMTRHDMTYYITNPNLSAKWRMIFTKLSGYIKTGLPIWLKIFMCIHMFRCIHSRGTTIWQKVGKPSFLVIYWCSFVSRDDLFLKNHAKLTNV